MVVLDTDLVSLIQQEHSPAKEQLQTRLAVIPLDERWTTIVSYEEQTRGWLAFTARARSLKDQVRAYQKLKSHLDAWTTMNVLEFTDQIAREFERLRQLRLRIGTQDLKIAATALIHQATLLSRNLKDFRRVPGLQVEDWTS
jgi:tRNA(fMet)-specific endonuclease VapC